MNWTPEPFHVWWKRMLPDPAPAPEPDHDAWAALKAQARELHAQFRERCVNLALRDTGIKVTIGGGRVHEVVNTSGA